MFRKPYPAVLETAALQCRMGGWLTNRRWYMATHAKNGTYLLAQWTQAGRNIPAMTTVIGMTAGYNHTLVRLDQLEAALELEANRLPYSSRLTAERALFDGTHYGLFNPETATRSHLARLAAALFAPEREPLPAVLHGMGVWQAHICAGSPGVTYHRAVRLDNGWTIQRITADPAKLGRPDDAHNATVLVAGLTDQRMFAVMAQCDTLMAGSLHGTGKIADMSKTAPHFRQFMPSLAKSLAEAPPICDRDPRLRALAIRVEGMTQPRGI